jgi:aldose 1-epimerase
MLARLFTLAALPLLAFAQSSNGTASADKNGKYEISSEGIRAHFIAYGASISNLFIEDIHGVERDIVLGFDNASYYEVDKQHPHLGGVPGRYANRIMNSTFEIDGEVFEIDANEHGGLNTLHGGCKCFSCKISPRTQN